MASLTVDLDGLIAQHGQPRIGRPLRQFLAIVQFVMIAQNQECSHRRIESAERFQKRSDLGVLQVHQIARAGDEVGLLIAQASDDFQRLVDWKQLAQMEVADMTDP